MRRLMVLLLFCSLLSLLSPWRIWSERYYITEEQLEMLQANLERQKKIVTEQEQELALQRKQLESLQEHLNESESEMMSLRNRLRQANESLRKSEGSELRNKVLVGTVCFVAGVAAGIAISR